VDPDSLNPVPDPVLGQGFDDQKFKKYGTAEKNIFFDKKNAIYLSLGLLKGRPGCTQKRTFNQQFKK
jgi:hypothetical protein